MALLCSTGFDRYSARADYFTYDFVSGLGWHTHEASAGRWGGPCMSANSWDDWAGVRLKFKPCGDPSAEIHFAAHYYPRTTLRTGSTSGDQGLIWRIRQGWDYSSDYSYMDFYNYRGTLQVYAHRAWSQRFETHDPIATCNLTDLFTETTWSHIEVAVKRSLGSDGFVKIWTDGNLVLDFSGVTAITAPTMCNELNFCTPCYFLTGSLSCLVDDVIVWDNSGTTFNAPQLGVHRITTLTPNAAGDSSDFTPSASTNLSCIDDAIFNDGDTTYNRADMTLLQDLFGYPSIPLSPLPVTIKGIITKTVARLESGTGKLLAVVKKGSSELYSDTVDLSTSYALYSHGFAYDPDTGAYWQPSDINSIQCGYRVSDASLTYTDGGWSSSYYEWWRNGPAPYL